MTEAEKYPIREDWAEYYNFLEALRRTGVTNMYGASIYLEDVEEFNLNSAQAKNVLCNWMHNYNELSKKYGWRM
jgi:hypothetical protein